MVFKEKTLESCLIYEGTILNLRKDKVTVSGNSTSYREIVEHNGGAVIVPVTDEGEVIMVRQFRKPFEKAMLELPAGKIDKGEEPKQTAIRELSEETGYRADHIEFICKMYPSVGYSNEILYIYVAEGLISGQANPDEHEELDIIKMPLEEAVGMVINGEICDGKTQVGLLLGEKRLKCI